MVSLQGKYFGNMKNYLSFKFWAVLTLFCLLLTNPRAGATKASHAQDRQQSTQENDIARRYRVRALFLQSQLDTIIISNRDLKEANKILKANNRDTIAAFGIVCIVAIWAFVLVYKGNKKE